MILSEMDRASRVMWQAAAARKRQWFASGSLPYWSRSRSVVRDVQFAHGVLLKYARDGKKFDPFWWA